MNFSETEIYQTIVHKINQYQIDHISKASRIQMSIATNKKLVNELDIVRGNESEAVIFISVIFGLDIEIIDELYDFDIIICGPKKKRNK